MWPIGYNEAMDSLHDILGRKDFEAAPEVAIIKNYAQEQFQAAVSVAVRERDIIISAPSAALISTLRMRHTELSRLAKTDKRLVFRIGN